MLKRLKDISEITMGQSPKSKYYNFCKEGLPFLQGRTTFGRLFPYYDTWATQYTKVAHADDILMSVRAPVGDLNICQTLTAIGRGIAAIRGTDIDTKYLYYLLLANKEHICSRSTGSVYDSISKPDLENLIFDLHKKQDQQHIVNILGSIDEKIESNDIKTQKLKELMQLIFKDFQNKIATANNYNLGEFISFIKGKKPLDMAENLCPYLTIDGMITGQCLNVSANNMVLAEEDDILMVMDGASSGAIYSGYKGVVGSTLAKLEINNTYLNSLIEQKLIQMQEKIKELNTGSAIPHANKEFIQSIKILLSNDNFQMRTIIKLNLLKSKIIEIRKSNIKLNRLKEFYIKKFFN